MRLEDQLAEDARKREEQSKAETKKTDGKPTEHKEGSANPTEAEKLDDIQNKIKRLRAEQELKAVQDGYKSYQDAVLQLSKDREQLGQDKLKYPDILAREQAVKEQEDSLQQRTSLAEQYSNEKHSEADTYYTSRKEEGDLSYKLAMGKFSKEYSEKSNILKELSADLQVKIDLYNKNIEPSAMLLAKDARLINQYLQGYIFPILNNGTLKLLGTFGGKLEITRRQAKLFHDALYTDAVVLLTMAEELKEK